MKRFKWLLRSLIIGSGMLLVAVTPQPVHAQDLTVRSELIPSQKQQLAQENWESYLANFLIDSNSSIHDYYLGEGFTSSTQSNNRLIYFPIIEKNTKDISYVLQVNEQNQMMLSHRLGESLNTVSKTVKSSSQQPVTIFNVANSMYYKGPDALPHLLIGYDSLSSSAAKQSDLDSPTNTFQLTQPLSQPKSRSKRSAIVFDHVLLPWHAYEIQHERPWCEWYAMTGVVNNLAGKQLLTAEQMLRNVYPGESLDQLIYNKENKPRNLAENFAFLKKKYNISVMLANGLPSFDVVKKELKERKAPLITDLISSPSNDTHAVVQIGYTASTSGNSNEHPYYYYWNPWWEDTFVASSTAPYFQLNDKQWHIQRYQYNYAKPQE